MADDSGSRARTPAPNAQGEVLRGIALDGTARVVVALSTGVAREGARRHGCVGAAAVALGRGLTAGVCLATLAKAEERVTLQILADGPLGGMTIDATGEGEVRGYLTYPAAFTAAGSACRTKLDVALGRNGVVNVLRDLGLRERYTGQAQLVTGEVDEDVEAYLRMSEQIDSALGCEVVLADAFTISAAAGVLVQALPASAGGPGEGTDLVRRMQHRLRTGELYDALAVAHPIDARAIATQLLGDVQVLDTRPIRFACRCSRDRVSGALALLGRAEIDDMLARDGRAEVFCNFCNERYEFDRNALEKLRARLPAHGVS